jgi:hypothetical protein
LIVYVNVDCIFIILKEPAMRRRLADALDCTDQTIVRYIKENELNGDLTKAVALKVISEESGLSTDEILEDTENITEKARVA